jgi:[FeFe] hydrogenase H-cluster maturation GTPase HydF
MVVQENELSEALNSLKNPPKLVVTDSQAIKEVSQKVPQKIPLTTFSILFSRFKGDLLEQTKGTLVIDELKIGDKILVAEACSHRYICEDIGRVKLPNWLNKYVGGKLDFITVVGHDFPDDLSSYKLIIHCGACMWNRKEVINRISECQEKSVPITNYGLVISKSLGVLERVVSPFPEVKKVLGRKS